MKNKLREESRGLRQEVREKTFGYIVGALGLVAGLAWNEAIKSLIDYFYPSSQGGIMPKFIYAILITVIIVITSTYLMRLATKKE